MKIWYASVIFYGVQLLTNAFGSMLLVKAENAEEAKRKIIEYLQVHCSVGTMGQLVAENPDRYHMTVSEYDFA